MFEATVQGLYSQTGRTVIDMLDGWTVSRIQYVSKFCLFTGRPPPHLHFSTDFCSDFSGNMFSCIALALSVHDEVQNRSNVALVISRCDFRGNYCVNSDCRQLNAFRGDRILDLVVHTSPLSSLLGCVPFQRTKVTAGPEGSAHYARSIA